GDETAATEPHRRAPHAALRFGVAHDNVGRRGSGRLSARSVQFFSLRTKLLLFAATLVIVPGAIYGAVTLSASRAAITRVVGRQLVVEARAAADRLAMTLRSEQERLDSFAAQDVM